MKKEFIITLALGMLVWTGCSSDGPEPNREPIVITMNQAESRAVEQSTEFGVELFKKICSNKEGQNVVMSPLSASICMSMLANGANDKARDEILTVMGLNNSADGLTTLNSINARLIESLPNTDNRAQVKIANSIWLRDNTQINNVFKKYMEDSYSALIDFADLNTQKGIQKVNAWVNKSTSGLIKTFFDEPENVSLAILNALYFNGKWAKPFDSADTKKRTFYGTSSNKAVDMMNQTDSYGQYRCDDFDMLVKDFGNGAFRMNFILPTGIISDVIPILTSEKISDAWSELTVSSVSITIPKLKINGDHPLIDILKAMGINDIFASSSIDRISDISYKVEGIRQKVVFEMDEEGAKAAAVTGITGDTAFIPMTSFILDHPFIFFISEKSTGAILFMGKVENL